MKRRFLAICLAALLTLTLLPAAAGAADAAKTVDVVIEGEGSLTLAFDKGDPVTVTGSQSVAVPDGAASATLTWQPGEGSVLETLAVNGEEIQAGEGTYEQSYPLDDLNGVTQVSAVFGAAAEAAKMLDVTIEGEGSLTVLYGEKKIDLTGSQAISGIPADADVTLKWNVSGDTYLQSLFVGGTEVTEETEASYTFNMGAFEGDQIAVKAVFGKYEMALIDVAIAGEGTLHMLENGKWEGVIPGEGTIEEPAGTYTFRADPADGYGFAGVTVDGEPAAVRETEDGYVFEAVLTDGGRIEVTFGRLANVSVRIEGNGTLQMYENGKWEGVMPGENTIEVLAGKSYTFRAYPAGAGMPIVLAVVNDKPVMAERQEDGGYEFTVDNIQDGDSIGAVFVTIDIGVLKTDEKTGISYLLPGTSIVAGSNITPDSWLEIAPLTEGSTYDAAKAAAAKYGTAFTAYDITLMNGAGAYQPNVPVMLKFPLPAGYSKDAASLRLLHIASDGSVEELEFGLGQDDAGAYYLETQVNGFSTFVIVDASQNAGSSGETEDAGKAPKTGDTENVLLLILLALASAGLIGCAARGLNGKKAR